MSNTDDEPWSLSTHTSLWRPCLSRLSRLALIAQSPSIQLEPLNAVIAHGERQIDGIRRRVLCGGTIPHAGKVYSILKLHIEGISKGIDGVSVDPGLRVTVSESRHSSIRWPRRPPFRYGRNPLILGEIRSMNVGGYSDNQTYKKFITSCLRKIR